MRHSNSFKRLRIQSQGFLDYVVLVCTAVPHIDMAIHSSNPLPATLPADHFTNISRDRLPPLIARYKEPLSCSIIVTTFSFFEGYVRSVIGEVVTFHGGSKDVRSLAARTFQRNGDKLKNPEIVKAKRSLQTPIDQRHADRYRKFSRVLRDQGYRFPTELFSLLGVETLLKKIDGSGFKAHELSNLLEAERVNTNETASSKVL